MGCCAKLKRIPNATVIFSQLKCVTYVGTAGEGDAWGQDKGLRGVANIGQSILSMRRVWAEVCILVQRVYYPQ
jgi:hypothetical protein